MTAHELLTQLREKGVEVKTSGDDRLVIDAPKGTITEELRGALSANKAELLQMLKAEQTARAQAATDEVAEFIPTAPQTVTSAPEIPVAAPEFAPIAPEVLASLFDHHAPTAPTAPVATPGAVDADAAVAASTAHEITQLEAE